MSERDELSSSTQCDHASCSSVSWPTESLSRLTCSPSVASWAASVRDTSTIMLFACVRLSFIPLRGSLWLGAAVDGVLFPLHPSWSAFVELSYSRSAAPRTSISPVSTERSTSDGLSGGITRVA